MKKTLIIAGLFLGLSTSTFAGTETSTIKITKVKTYANAVVIKIDKNAQNSGCTFSSKKYLHLDMSTEKGKAIYSTILTAFTTNAKAVIAYNGCRSWWGATLPKIYRVDMVK